MALYPLHEKLGLSRFLASTYQAVSGSGFSAMKELAQQTINLANKIPFQPQFYNAFNFFSEVCESDELGYCKEEQKLLQESRKILGLPNIQVSVSVLASRTYSIVITP